MFDVLNQAPVLPFPKSKLCPLVCVLQLSSVHTVQLLGGTITIIVFLYVGSQNVDDSALVVHRTVLSGLYWPF